MLSGIARITFAVLFAGACITASGPPRIHGMPDSAMHQQQLSELEALADTFAAVEYGVAPVVDLVDGLWLRVDAGGFGEIASETGHTMQDGIWFCLAESTLSAPDQYLEAPFLSMLMIDDDAPLSGCEVTCGAGFFACCYHLDDGSAVCRCKRPTHGTTDEECRAGGQGAVYCALKDKSVQPPVSDD
jgi:hypothetical protein